MFYLDAHSHPQFKSYDADREEILARAKSAGVKLIAVGTQTESSASAIALAEKYPGDIWSTVGFHPSHLALAEHWHHDKHEQEKAEQESFDPEKLKELAKNPKVVAIGECGLDYYRAKGGELRAESEARKRQEDAFIAQVEIACALGKPLMIHCRSAFRDLIDILLALRSKLLANPGIIHFMTGSPDDARALLDLGFAFTFGGVITFTRDYDEAIKIIPPENLLSETDAPYVAPTPYRGKRNEPAYVVEVVKKLAELKGLPEEAMRDQIWQNASRVFNIT